MLPNEEPCSLMTLDYLWCNDSEQIDFARVVHFYEQPDHRTVVFQANATVLVE